MKLNKDTCPKPVRWFEEGGICGFGHECKYCSENPDKARKHEGEWRD